MRHTIDNRLLTKQVNVALIGCGGTGSQVLTGLARLHTAMTALGHPHGLQVTAYDDDLVSESNVGRQLFSPVDVGINKAELLIYRLNCFFGLDWGAVPAKFDRNGGGGSGFGLTPDIIITCTDTKSSRREVHEYVTNKGGVKYWLDTGNMQTTGQVILGEPMFRYEKKKARPMRLPTVIELFPEILDESIPEDNNIPSCSLAAALEQQDLFIGQSIATFGLQLLWSLFRNGGADHHGYFVNLTSGAVRNLPVDPEVWKRFLPKKQRPSQKKAAAVSEELRQAA